MSALPPRPEPRITHESKAYWAAARTGRLMIATCGNCHRLHHAPQAVCPFCWSSNVITRAAGGRGTLQAFSVVHQTAVPEFRVRLPYVVAYVDLEEGVSLVSNIVNCDLDKVRIGMAVKAVFEPMSDKSAAILFEPA